MLFRSLGVRIWDCITAIFTNSVLYWLFVKLVKTYKRSLLAAFLEADGLFNSVWSSSTLRRSLEFLINAVTNLLNRAISPLGRTARNSFFLRLFESLGVLTPYLISLGIFAFFIIPQERWNNSYSLLLMLAALALFYVSAIRNRARELSLRNLGPWTVVYAVTVILSYAWSQNTGQSTRFLFFSVTCILLVLVFVSSIETERGIYFAVLCIGAGMCICSLYAVYQSINGIEASKSFTDLDLNFGMPGRAFSFFENPNSFANVLVFFTPLMLSMGFYAPRTREKLFFFSTASLGAVALLLTYCRGSWVAFAFAVFILMAILCPRWIPLVIVIGVVIVPFLPQSILNRILTIFNSSDSSISSRSYIYSAVIKIIAKNPIFGVGLGSNTLKYAIESASVYNAHFPFIHAHNIYLEIWAESGIFALTAFCFALYHRMRKGIRRIAYGTSPLLKGIIAGCVSGLSGSLLFGITDFAWGYPRVMVLFWFLFALLCSANKLSKNYGLKEILYNGK